MTLDAATIELRAMIADTNTPYRWEDGRIHSFINVAIQRLFSDRPDAFSGFLSYAPADLVLGTDELPCRAEFIPAVLFYAAATLIMQRSSDKSLRKQADDLLADYAKQILKT
jgi:hypothetical protein